MTEMTRWTPVVPSLLPRTNASGPEVAFTETLTSSCVFATRTVSWEHGW